MESKYHFQNEEALINFARQFARDLRGGDVVALAGELGAGKTTFVRAASQALGVDMSVTSPTFTIWKTYPVHNGLAVCHIDLYRLSGTREHLGFEELLGDKDHICFIEWPEHVRTKLPPHTYWLAITVLPDGSREIRVRNTKPAD